MKKILCLSLFLAVLGCGKKEWPQPMVSGEMIRIDHLEASMDQDCLLINAKMGGKLINLEYFLVEIEEDGCPTCPFNPSFVQKYYPYSSGVYRRENSYIFTICQPWSGTSLRLRLQADNTHRMIEPGFSEIITITLP